MNRRSRHLVVLSVAVVTATIASFAIYRALLQRPALAASAPNQPVVVARHAMAIGTAITEQDVKVVSWPGDSPLPGAIGNIKDVIGRGLLTTVMENDPITTNRIAASGAGLAPAIPPGMRAMSVKVNDVIGVAGFVVPKSRVDVVVTIRRQSDSMTRTAASNIEVLAVGTRQDQGKAEGDSKTPNASTAVTLIVSPKDAEKITLAQAEGEIMLMLRNPADTADANTSGVRTDQLLGLPEPAAAPAPRPATAKRPTPPPPTAKTEDPKPQPYMVEGIRGGKRTNEEVKDAKTAGADVKSGGLSEKDEKR
jgi:pilus assembly protein CpaB